MRQEIKFGWGPRRRPLDDAASSVRAVGTSEAPADHSLKGAPFETLLELEIPVLYRVACRMTKDATTAEDVVGLTVLKALENRSQWSGRFLRSWLIQILRRTYLTELNRPCNRTHANLGDVDATQPDLWPTLGASLLSQQLTTALDQLPEEFRMAVVLCDMEELSYEDAARALAVPVGTVRSRLFRGRRILRERTAHLFDIR